jgi:outer membrane protein assembly factor BamB
MKNKFVLLACLLALSACDSLPDWMGSDEEEVVLPGERIAVLEYRRSLEADEALSEEKVELMAPETNPDWRFDLAPQLEGFENLTVTGFEDSTSATIGNGESWETVLASQPVVGDGTVYAMDAQGYVTAHDASDITTIKWESEAPTSPDEDDISGGGLAYADGVVYVTTGRGVLMALVAKDGSVLWKQQVDVPIRAAPVIDDGRVFAVTIDNQLLAHDARTGKPLWSHRGIKESALYLGTVSPSVLNGIVVVAYTSGELYALRAEDGSPLWSDTLIVNRRTAATATLTGIDATPVIKGNTVYGLSNSGLMVANLLSNGRGQWDLEVSGHLTPWVSGDYIFVITSDPQLLAVNRRDGRIKWATPLLRQDDDGDDETPGFTNPMVINGQVAVAANNGELMMFSVQDGTLVQTIEIPDDLATEPVVAGGRMYLLTRDATLHMLQ